MLLVSSAGNAQNKPAIKQKSKPNIIIIMADDGVPASVGVLTERNPK
jgi:hypothetical protein